LTLLIPTCGYCGSDETEPRCRHVVRIGGSEVSQTRVSFDAVDHCPLDGLLGRFVDNDGLVDYGAWKANPRAISVLYHYLISLGEVDSRLPASRQGKLAYYINAYNALTIWGILQVYPTVSIQTHNREGANYRIFDDLQLWLDGRYLSLNDIEHQVLRKMNDPRIHFALVCAARGCPRLRNAAYVPSRLEEQLIDNTMDFFAHHNRFSISPHSHSVTLSPLLDWYSKDFGPTIQDQMTYFLPYLSKRDRIILLSKAEWNIRYGGYDWSLNDQSPPLLIRPAHCAFAIYAHVQPFLERREE